MNRLFIFLSVVSFCFAHYSMAHGQTIVIRQTDFAGAGAFPGTVASGDAPMRIVPATIGRGHPSFTSVRQGFPPGLLIPRTAEATSAAPAIVVTTDATPAALPN